MDRAYWEDDVSEESLDEMINWDDEGDFYSDLWNPVVSGGSTLKQISVFPQPQQDPHPQIWEPLTTPRSIEWAAKNGVNGVMNVEPNSRFAKNVETYMEAAEEAGWPDHRPEYDGEEFKYGWDEGRGRGMVTTRWIFNTDVHGDGEVLDRWKKGLENGWAFYGPFGFAAVLAEGDEELYDPSEPVDADTVIDKDVAIVGDTDTIRDKCAKYKEETGLTDFNMVCWFETAGFTPDEADEQIEHFGEHIIPYLEEEFPGPENSA
jgi:alkanesulfonate monooxygenase SsuD/methylene tetrahydromethanopterin reductase-like flavin-dependent oxidoreductase (luciferase family)